MGSYDKDNGFRTGAERDASTRFSSRPDTIQVNVQNNTKFDGMGQYVGPSAAGSTTFNVGRFQRLPDLYRQVEF